MKYNKKLICLSINTSQKNLAINVAKKFFDRPYCINDGMTGISFVKRDSDNLRHIEETFFEMFVLELLSVTIDAYKYDAQRDILCSSGSISADNVLFKKEDIDNLMKIGLLTKSDNVYLLNDSSKYIDIFRANNRLPCDLIVASKYAKNSIFFCT